MWWPSAARLAEKAGAALCRAPDEEGLAAIETALAKASGGLGADRVFLAAGGSSNEPAEVAARLARDRATIVDIGKCKLDLPWSAYYEKELDLRFSRFVRARSLRPAVRGPGRRLSGRLRPLDRTTQPGLLRGPCGPGRDRPRATRGGDIPRDRSRRGLRTPPGRRCARRRLLVRVPEARPVVSDRRGSSPLDPVCGHERDVPRPGREPEAAAAGLHRRRQLRPHDAPPAPRGERRRRVDACGHLELVVGGQRQA